MRNSCFTNRTLTSNFCNNLILYFNAKKIHGFISCIVISVYQLDVPSMKKGAENRNS